MARTERPAGGARPQWFVHEDADPRIARVKFPQTLPADLKSLTGEHRARVMARRAILDAFESFARSAACTGRAAHDVETLFIGSLACGYVEVKLPANMKQPSVRTLRRWKAAYRLDGLAGLFDGRLTTADPGEPDDDPFFVEVRRHYLTLRS